MSSSSAAAAAAAATPEVAADPADSRYHFDAEELQKLRSSAPWMKDPKYFEKVAISPSAIMKIMMHCQSGVEKGIAKGGNPLEVMGMLLGRPDPSTPHTLVVTDAFPLPIEGFETRVVADDENVVNHMISLGESLETTRNEKFMGWYHSHPFDLAEHSHCFLSQTDLTTELQWQRAEDPFGNPFIAIVVDPLRSLALEQPQLKAFRAYPPDYNSPVANECPDGSIQPIEQVRLEQWGSCWNRYYELQVEYYMSLCSQNILVLAQDSLWMRNLMARETPTTQQLKAVNREFQTASTAAASVGSTAPAAAVAMGLTMPSSSAAAVAASSRSGGGGGSSSSSSNTRVLETRPKEWSKAVQQLSNLAVEQLGEATLQKSKEIAFG